jgi:hypothetical protein
LERGGRQAACVREIGQNSAQIKFKIKVPSKVAPKMRRSGVALLRHCLGGAKRGGKRLCLHVGGYVSGRGLRIAKKRPLGPFVYLLESSKSVKERGRQEHAT